ncbi:T9SS type A sorting domain-containing protein [Hymenobacter sp. BT186]|uniref:T9SS type A sorting domain-containing protein n=2 Tax=Hymenobacter telluris TaxID=2816474 RepID=A0A939F174_9BACT|nr:T9SS type A sorting domain-containing protein [Hymenobacter telluris]MBW3376257.1 T9SS type A sorting domain-containing protein [Hymenobacter norwichensis]
MQQSYFPLHSKLATAVALCLIGTAAHAQLATYSFTGAAGSEATFAPNSQPANATFSSMSRGAGITGSAGANTFAATDWSTAALDATDYFEFSVQPAIGFRLRLDSLVLDERRSGTGIRDWAIRSSLDNFATNLIAVNVPDDTDTRANRKLTLPTSFATLTAPVTFRIYGYNAEAAAGSWRVDNVRTYGLVSTTLSTASATKNAAVSIYPNPTADVVSIRINGKATNAPVSVSDLTGRKVLSGTAAADGTFSLRSLPAGSYVVSVQDGAASATYKVVKH